MYVEDESNIHVITNMNSLLKLSETKLSNLITSVLFMVRKNQIPEAHL
jgi:hypothetical protein